MGTSIYSDEFKRDAVQQITVHGYPVREVSRRLGVSSHSVYKWMRQFGEPAPKASGVDHEAEARRLKRELPRVTEERDILKRVSHGSPLVQEPWRTRTSRASPNEVRLHPGASDRVPRPGHVPCAADSRQRLLRMALRNP
jgi:transposase-like protein